MILIITLISLHQLCLLLLLLQGCLVMESTVLSDVKFSNVLGAKIVLKQLLLVAVIQTIRISLFALIKQLRYSCRAVFGSNTTHAYTACVLHNVQHLLRGQQLAWCAIKRF